MKYFPYVKSNNFTKHNIVFPYSCFEILFLWYMGTPPPLLKKVSYSRFSQFLPCLRCLSEWQQGTKVRYGQNKGKRN